MTQEQTNRELVDLLIATLEMKAMGGDVFEGPRTPVESMTGAGRIFGGQVIAQALAAAEQTRPEGSSCHSMHGYFLRMGSDEQPVDYQIARDFDGRSFANRRVAGIQNGKPIFTLTASFHKREPGQFYQAQMPDVPPPEEVECDQKIRLKQIDLFPAHRRKALSSPRPVEQRTVGGGNWFDTTPRPPELNVWMRVAAPIGDDMSLHRILLAYCSDFNLLRTATLPLGTNWFNGTIAEASLDHSIWFHEDFRIDEWLLFSLNSTWSGHGRGMGQGSVFRRDGTLVASLSQEGMLRLLKPRKTEADQPAVD